MKAEKEKRRGSGEGHRPGSPGPETVPVVLNLKLTLLI